MSRRLPIWTLYERARSLGLAVQVSSQSWQGLAADDDERYRIAATADGGIWLLRTPYPDPLADLAGEQRRLDTTRRLLGGWLWSGEGHSRAQYTKVVNPEIIRSLDVGQAAYISRGGVTYVQVKRVVAGPAALPAPVPVPLPRPWLGPGPGPGTGPSAPHEATAPGDEQPGQGPGHGSTGPHPLPDATPFLDEVLGGSHSEPGQPADGGSSQSPADRPGKSPADRPGQAPADRPGKSPAGRPGQAPVGRPGDGEGDL